MKITSIQIANFKAIKSATLELHPTMNVLVGANGSGKSSVLQAFHWMIQSARSNVVSPGAPSTNPNQSDKASTLSEKDAIYMPSPDYRSAGHGGDYGNAKDKPQLDVHISAIDESGQEITAAMWLKSARNEGISVHIPSGNAVVAKIRDMDRDFSAYIPGVAGIALEEEKKSKLLVHRSAAAGDANTVLRNILVLLERQTINGTNGLKLVEELVSQVMGEFRLRVEFDEEKHTRIMASFQTGRMREVDDRSYRPLEFAGIGYLQVLQIFSYLVYFRPVVVLVDEPDAHLYPVAQEKLVRVLAEAAATYDAQVLLTTHSPSIARSLPTQSKVIWMKDGEVHPDGNTNGRQLMGWGLLDRRILLMTEDELTHMLRAIIAQWPDLERLVAIWPLHGATNLPPAEAASALKLLLGDDVSIVMHQDRDFLMPSEAEKLADQYSHLGHHLWFTKHSDLESYWATPNVIAAHFDISEVDAQSIIDTAVSETVADEKALQKMRSKRLEAINKLNRKGNLAHFGEREVIAEYTSNGGQFQVLGKTLIGAIRQAASEAKLANASSFGTEVPSGIYGTFVTELKDVLERSVK